MKKLSISLLLLLGLAGCSNVTGVTAHKDRLHALVQVDDNKCIVKFNNDTKQNTSKPMFPFSLFSSNSSSGYEDIKADITCDQVKYFDEK